MSKTRLLLIVVFMLLASEHVFSQSDFQVFWAKFRSAVQRNDKSAVRSMMAPRFEWALDGYVSRDEAWQMFNRDRSNWPGLRQAVNRTPAKCASPYCNNRNGYRTWSSRRYRIEIMFERVGGQWRWSALLGD